MPRNFVEGAALRSEKGAKGMRFIKAAVVAVGLALAPLAALAAAPASSLSAADQADIARIESYLDGIHTMRGHFLQSTEGDVYAEGAFYIDRPGKMRIQYDPPTPFFMVASGSTLSFYDGRIKKSSFVPIDMTPAYFLIRDKVGLGDSIVASHVERGDASLRVTVYEREHPDRGRMMLTFSDRPLELKKWKMIDKDGNETDISIVNTEYNVKLDPNLFRFDDPAPTALGHGSNN